MVIKTLSEVEWTKRGEIKKDRQVWFDGPVNLNHGYETLLERLPDDGLKITTTVEDEFGLDSKVEIIIDRFDLEKIKQFIQ